MTERHRARLFAVLMLITAAACSNSRKAPEPAPATTTTTAPSTTSAPVALTALQQARRDALAKVEAGDVNGAMVLLLAALNEDHPDGLEVDDARCDLAALGARAAMQGDDLQRRERQLQETLQTFSKTPAPAACARRGEELHRLLADTLVRRARALGGSSDDDSLRIALLREALKHQVTPAAQIDLAVVLEKRDEPREALTLAEAALATLRAEGASEASVAGVARLVERLQKTVAVEGDFKSARHSHFVARFEGYAEERLAFKALDTLESAYFSVGKALDLHPSEPTTVVIYTGAQYQQATTAPDWSTGLFDGKIRIREGQLQHDDGSLDDTLVHEYVHAALHSLPVPVPSWFHEGLAQHFEAHRAPPARLVGRTGIAGREALDAPFTRLPPDVVPAAYVTAHALVERLVERRGAWGLRQLVAELKAGRDFNEALQRAYALDVDALYADVRGSLGGD